MTTLPRYLNYNIPAITIQFDDGYGSVYSEAFTYMQTLGVKGNAFVYNTYTVTAAQLQEMYAAGWDIGNHSISAVANNGLPFYNLADQQAAIETTRDHLLGLGFTRSARHMTYPAGLYNADTLTAMANLEMLTGNTAGTQSREKMHYHAGNLYLFPIYSHNFAFSDDYFIDYFQAAQKMGQVAMVAFHDIVESGATGNQCNRANFRAIIDWIHASGMPVLTISQLYALTLGSIEI